MSNLDNLKPYKKGESGNPNGRPKGSLNLATKIRNYLDSEQKVEVKGKTVTGVPSDLIVEVMTQKAIDGEMKAVDWLARYGYGSYRVDLADELSQATSFVVTRGIINEDEQND